MNNDFITYEDIEVFIDNFDRYTYEYMSNDLHIFYDYGSDSFTNEQISMREPLFSISLISAFVIVAPYGYRLTQSKRMKNFNELEEKALQLARTPIFKRGKRKVVS